MATPSSESHSSPAVKLNEVELVKCDSCGFSEECTVAYIACVRERYHGRWICGLCAAAVKHEAVKSGKKISTEEALNMHINLCRNFRSSSPPLLTTAESPILVMGRVLRRRMDSPRHHLRSVSSSMLPQVNEVRPRSTLARSESCIPSLSR